MSSGTNSEPLEVIERLLAAINRHDLDAFVACFAADYRSEQPLHPDRAFQGSDQVRRNWAAVFAGMPDVHWELLDAAVAGERIWIEVRASGTRAADGERVELGGVLIAEVREASIAASRIYFEEIERAGAGIDASITELYQAAGSNE